MSPIRSTKYLIGLVHELRKLPRETEWVEFKRNNENPEKIGEYLSALSNAAAFEGKAFAYLMWGVEDGAHDIVGTGFVPTEAKVGNEELESWLLRLLEPKLDFRFFEVTIEGLRVVILEIDCATRQPVRFKGQEWIRVGSYSKKLKDYPEKERRLWRIFDDTPYEAGCACENVDSDEVLRLLDYPGYFDLLARPFPEGRSGILEALCEDALINSSTAGGWDITNLGAVLFAKNLADFSGITRKAMRVIQYGGSSRIETIKEQVGGKGYATGFEGIITYINGLIPTNEVIQTALRKSVPMYPELAVRELVANALIHQDFFVTGAGPMVEIFDNRIEITNPGEPLVAAERFLDTPPKSRNEKLASLMRRMGICEERGSGVDKVVHQTETYQLPPPLIEVTGQSTRVVLFSQQPLNAMQKEDRVRACYLHACLKYVNREFLTNSTIRERFGISPSNRSNASRLIKEATEAKKIKAHDPKAAPKNMRYKPWWAG